MGAVESTPERLRDFLKASDATPLVMIDSRLATRSRLDRLGG
jgi:hypothetical protein